jgi:hypothetical protein
MSAVELESYDVAAKTQTSEQLLNDPRFGTCCHVFVTKGEIQFLGDCTHELKNKTVPIPAWPNDRTLD